MMLIILFFGYLNITCYFIALLNSFLAELLYSLYSTELVEVSNYLDCCFDYLSLKLLQADIPTQTLPRRNPSSWS